MTWLLGLLGWGGALALAAVLLAGFTVARNYVLIAACAVAVLVGLWGWNGYRSAAATRKLLDAEVAAHATTAGQRDTARAARDEAIGKVSLCNKSVDAYAAAAALRAEEAAPARAAAANKAHGHQQKANQILATPPSVAGDDYASARERAEQWLKGRSAQ